MCASDMPIIRNTTESGLCSFSIRAEEVHRLMTHVSPQLSASCHRFRPVKLTCSLSFPLSIHIQVQYEVLFGPNSMLNQMEFLPLTPVPVYPKGIVPLIHRSRLSCMSMHLFVKSMRLLNSTIMAPIAVVTGTVTTLPSSHNALMYSFASASRTFPKAVAFFVLQIARSSLSSLFHQLSLAFAVAPCTSQPMYDHYTH